MERLRARKLFWLNGGAWMMGVDPDPDCAEAAAEIERLRAALRGAIGMVEMLGVPLSHSGHAELDGYRRAMERK